jgi:L-threonylcarbamoyladenylate synthase
LKDHGEETFNPPCIRSLGSEKDVGKMAANLFSILREFDQTDVAVILAEALEDREMGYAIMNRLSKAAGQNILYVDEEARS